MTFLHWYAILLKSIFLHYLGSIMCFIDIWSFERLNNWKLTTFLELFWLYLIIKRINFKKRVTGWYKVQFLRDYLRLFWIHPIFLVRIYIFSGMILKMKKFVIQWRKFEWKKELYKESYKFLNFMEFSRFYFDFSGIFWIFWI